MDYLYRVSPNSYYNLDFTRNSGYFYFCIGRHGFRVELYFGNDPAKVMIDAMAKYRNEIEAKFDGKLEWERLNDKKASRIKHEMPNEFQDKLESKFNDEIYWNDLINWYVTSMEKFYNALNPYLKK